MGQAMLGCMILLEGGNSAERKGFGVLLDFRSFKKLEVSTHPCPSWKELPLGGQWRKAARGSFKSS